MEHLTESVSYTHLDVYKRQVVYSTDAATTDGVEVVASAPEGSHQPITYPAAVLKTSKNADEANAFLEYLKSDECTEVFENAGFVIPER